MVTGAEADIVYTDEAGGDAGVVPWADGDFAIGEENTWSLKVRDDVPAVRDCFVYIDGTEFGGVVDDIETSSGKAGKTISGRTWHGMLGTLVVCPPAGQAHAVLSGEANGCIARILELSGAGEPFAASGEDSGIEVARWQAPRYCTAYEALTRMLAAGGARLSISFSRGTATLSAVDAGAERRWSDTAGFDLKRVRPVNHLVCLGKGELEARTVVHLYADSQGRVSRTQSIFGRAHMAETYELSQAEDEAELVEKGTAKLEEMQGSDEADMDDLPGGGYALGQVLTAHDVDRGVAVEKTVVKAIARVSGRSVRVEYQAGDPDEPGDEAA